MSSGVVSGRTRITSSPALASSTARSESKTTFPAAAPGEAATPVKAAGGVGVAIFGRWSCSNDAGDTRETAVGLSISSSSAIVTASRTAASAVLFPILAWRM